MRESIKILLASLLLIIAHDSVKGSIHISSLGVDEVSALLDGRNVAASAKGAVTESVSNPGMPVFLTAEDMISKLYGVISSDVSREECLSESSRLLGLMPEYDGGVLWLDSDEGYRINYSGMMPEVSAVVRYGDDTATAKVSDYGFFFLFPYSGTTKDAKVREQADFCGSLLQEIYDTGLSMELNTASDDLFEAIGVYGDKLVDIRLLDESVSDGSGRYILILSVEPDAFSGIDELTAEN